MFLSENIKQIRKMLGMTQAELSETSGVSQGNLAQYEKGAYEPKLSTLVKIAAALKVPVETFFEKSLRENLLPSTQSDPEALQLPLLVLKKNNASLKFSKEGRPQIKEKIHASQYFTIKDPNAYAFRMPDDSMFPGIQKGWVLLVSPKAEVKENDHVLASLPNNEFLLRTLHMQSSDELIFKPLNTNYEPVSISRKKIDFIHKVIHIVSL